MAVNIKDFYGNSGDRLKKIHAMQILYIHGHFDDYATRYHTYYFLMIYFSYLPWAVCVSCVFPLCLSTNQKKHVNEAQTMTKREGLIASTHPLPSMQFFVFMGA